MRLDHDLVRRVMLYLEENLDSENRIPVNSIMIPEYKAKDIEYTCEKLIEADYIKSYSLNADNIRYIFEISAITYEGHLFLDSVRDDSIWKATKAKVKPLASVSLEILKNVASAIVLDKLGLNKQ